MVNTGNLYDAVESCANKTGGLSRPIARRADRFHERNYARLRTLQRRVLSPGRAAGNIDAGSAPIPKLRWLCCVWQLRELPSPLCCRDFSTDRYNTSPSTPVPVSPLFGSPPPPYISRIAHRAKIARGQTAGRNSGAVDYRFYSYRATLDVLNIFKFRTYL